MIHFGQKIKDIIKERGLKQTDIASKINVSSSNFQYLLSSEDISVQRLEQLSQILDYNFFQHLDLPNMPVEEPRKRKASVTLMVTIDDPQKEDKVLKMVLGRDFKL